MIFCNGCSKSGTHILTNICRSLGRKQVGGTVVKRLPEKEIIMKGERNLDFVFSRDNNFYVHAHIAYSNQLELAMARHKHLHIYRDPREIAVSWMRHRVKQNSDLTASKELLIDLISSGMFGVSVPDFYLGFAGWFDQKRIMLLEFSELVSRRQDLTVIDKYLNVPTGTLNYDDILGNSSTYTGSYSVWQDWWDDEVEQVWLDSQGKQADQAFKSALNS